MAKLAFMTTGPMLYPMSDPKIASYGQLANEIFDELQIDDGFLGMSPLGTEGSWGEWTVPRMYQKDEHNDRILQTLSLWRDLEAIFAYSYYGHHTEALKRRSEWFPENKMVNHVAWWVADEHRPTWAEGAKLYDEIIQNGSTPKAFNLREPYSIQGEPVKLNHDILKAKRKLYQKNT